ncbi:SIS domain-containing protein [Chloroflexota bacterium]
MLDQDLQYVGDYISQLTKLLTDTPRAVMVEIVSILRNAREEGQRVFVFGNGGSAATASHMACDLGKNTRVPGRPHLRIICLNEGIPTMTAYANDEGYEKVFSEPLLSLAESGDVAIAVSGSGNSPNVLKGVQTAKELKLKTVGLTGFEGGKLEDMVDTCLVVPSDSMEKIEDVHLIVNHILTVLLRA